MQIKGDDLLAINVTKEGFEINIGFCGYPYDVFNISEALKVYLIMKI